MRKLSIVPLILFLFAAAGHSEALFGNEYSYSEWHDYGEYTPSGDSFCDDFILDNPASLSDSIVVWMCFSGSPVADLDLSIGTDDGSGDPNNATIIFDENLPCTCIDTGDQTSYTGSHIYKVVLDLSSITSPPSLDANQLYWLYVDEEYQSDYLLMGPVHYGSCAWGWAYGSYIPIDSYFDPLDIYVLMYGTASSSLDRSSWGNIKTLF